MSHAIPKRDATTATASQRSGTTDEPAASHYDAFISYSHHDREFVGRLLQALAERGKAAWQDESGILPAERWRPALRHSIEGADAFVFVMTPHSAVSPECRMELDYALSLNKRVIPVAAGAVGVDALPPSLADFQFIPPRGTFDDDFEACADLLVRAIDTDLDWVREHTQWTLKAVEWNGHERDVSFLLAGSELEAAEHWLARQSGKRPEPTTLDNEFVLASRRHVTRRLRRTRAITAAALAVMTVLAVTALVLRNQAVNQSQIAYSRQLAADSLLELSSDPQLSLLLGVEAADVRQTPEALEALRRALPSNHLIRTLQQNDSPVYEAALSPDEKLIGTASKDNVVRVWTTSGRLLRVLRGHTADILGVTFDSTSRKVLTWAEDGTARLWNIYGSAPPVVLHAPDYRVIHAAISPNGRLVATSTFLHSPPQLWDAATGKLLFTLGTGQTPVPDVEFSLSGGFLATSSVTGTVSFWNVSTGSLLARLNVATSASPSSQADVNEALFSPDGRDLLVSTSDELGDDPQSQVWNLATFQPVTPVLRGGDARWSPDGRFVITTGADGNARVWNAATGQLIHLLHGPDPITGPALLSPDNGTGAPLYALTGSQDGTADLWNPVDGTLLETLVGTTGTVTPVAFWPDASEAVTFGNDGSARIWNTGAVVPQPAPDTARLAATVRALGGAVNQVHVSAYQAADPLAPLAAFYDLPSDATATVVDVQTGARLDTFPFPSGHSVGRTGFNPAYVSFDSGGSVMLVTGDGEAQLRAARTGRLLHTLSGPGSLAADGVMSPDGTLAATVDVSGRIYVWDVATGHHLVTFTRQAVAPGSFADVNLKFSPDSSLLLSADLRGVTFVWQARTGRVLNEIRGPAPPAGMFNEETGGAISPDDQYVVTTAGWDDDAHVYKVGQPGEVISLLGHTDGIDDATFSADGTLIATTAGHSVCTGAVITPLCDNSTRVWDIQQSAPLLTLPNDGGTRVDFSSSGTTLAVNTLAPYEYGGVGAAPPEDQFPYDTLACVVCGGFDRLIPLAEAAETHQLTPTERAEFLNG
jgi:WD40 repeat protein